MRYKHINIKRGKPILQLRFIIINFTGLTDKDPSNNYDKTTIFSGNSPSLSGSVSSYMIFYSLTLLIILLYA